MEYELFRSKLKSSVDGAFVSDIIRSSSSGLNSHRTAAMELILERSIQERRERMSAKAKKSVQPDPTSQPKRTSEAPNVPIPEVKPPAPAPAPVPQQQSRSLPRGTTGTAISLASASTKYEASQDLSALTKSTREVEAARGKQPPADIKTNPPPPKEFLELACWRCKVKQPRSSLRYRIYCSLCPREARGTEMWCVGCGTIRRNDDGYCTGCHGRFN